MPTIHAQAPLRISLGVTEARGRITVAGEVDVDAGAPLQDALLGVRLCRRAQAVGTL